MKNERESESLIITSLNSIAKELSIKPKELCLILSNKDICQKMKPMVAFQNIHLYLKPDELISLSKTGSYLICEEDFHSLTGLRIQNGSQRKFYLERGIDDVLLFKKHNKALKKVVNDYLKEFTLAEVQKDRRGQHFPDFRQNVIEILRDALDMAIPSLYTKMNCSQLASYIDDHRHKWKFFEVDDKGVPKHGQSRENIYKIISSALEDNLFSDPRLIKGLRSQS